MTALNGFGIFTWGSHERVSDRYGSFVLDRTNFGGDATVTPKLDDLSPLLGRRTKVTIRVVDTRKSGHIGDAFLGISPTTPDLGAMFEFIGNLHIGPADWGGHNQIVIAPLDGRRTFWMNPEALYQLHDQTVEVTFEETTDPCPAPFVFGKSEKGIIDNGDGSFQTKNVDPTKEVRLVPDIEYLGDGTFIMRPPSSVAGRRVRYREGG
jgi:hypothetical protein